LAAVASVAGIEKLYSTGGLEATMTPPRKPEHKPRRVIRVGIPATEKVDTWISVNQLLHLDAQLAEEAATILKTAPK